MEQLIISLLLSLAGTSILVACSFKMLQIYQLSSYRASGFLKWLKRTGGDYIIRYFSLAFFQFISLLIFSFCFPDSYLKYLAVALYIALGVYFVFLQIKQKQKTPLKITKRIGRQLAVLSVLYFALSFLSVYFTFDYAVKHSLLAVLTLLIPAVVTLSHFIALPIENMINAYYKRKAAKALRGGIVKIGITGSYGKTTSKNILAALLSQKYKVLASPLSHNTPMGICKLINAGISGYDVLIAEMGARHRGDIAELCQLIKPDYGIITVTGPQHLETFGSTDEIVKTKLELAENALGAIVLNSDDTKLMETAGRIAKSAMDFTDLGGSKIAKNLKDSKDSELTDSGYSKIATDLNSSKDSTDSGDSIIANLKDSKDFKDIKDSTDSRDGNRKIEFLYSGQAGADAFYSDVKVTSDGTSFAVTIDGQRAQITTVLLGRHIPALFTQCALLAYRLGVSLPQIEKAAADIKPVEHRLQLIKSQNGTIIDDAYNANPEGAKNALEVLGLFEGTKVIITPGFVEMGILQSAENKNLGALAAQTADYIISVNSGDICAGAKEAGMDNTKVFEENSLKDATERLMALNLVNPVILFLNDLPDNY